jgi:hypothetical protein
MNTMSLNGGVASFIFRVSRNSLSSHRLKQTIALLKIGIDFKPILNYPISERSFETAFAVFGNVEYENLSENFGELLKSSTSGLGFFLPDAAELVSFIYYNAHNYSNHFPENLICGIRKNPKDNKEIILILNREGLDDRAEFALKEIPVNEIGKGFEVVPAKEQKDDG